MKKTFISYIPFKDILFGKKQISAEYQYEPTTTINNAKNSIEETCINCLRNNGYSEDCLNNFTLDCRNSATNYCDKCLDECQNLCNENAGGGVILPYRNFSDSPEILSYNNYDYNLKAYPITSNLEKQGPYGPVNSGTNIISPATEEQLNGKDPCGTFNPAPFKQECITCLQQNNLLSTLNCGCSDYYTEECENELIKNKELISSVCCESCKDDNIPEKLKYTNQNLIAADCVQQNSNDQNFNSSFSFRSGSGDINIGGGGPNTGSGGSSSDDDIDQGPGGGGGGGSPPVDCPDACKVALFYPRGAPGTDPFYVMYKHTGCHLVWYPPEYGFDNNPFITQCKGFIDPDRDPVSCHPEYAYYDRPIGSDPSTYDYGKCSAYQRNAWGLWPCYCMKFPHIRGGIYDTLYKLPNINTSENQFGYISYLDPFTPPMKYSEADCCYCGSTRESVPVRNGQVTWPQWFGQYWNQAPQGFAGSNCTPGSDLVTPFVNTGYKENCYEYGISPYLRRVAETDHKPGYDIWTYGGGSQNKQDLGPFYSVRNFSQRSYWFDFVMDWDEVTAQPTKLQNSLIGFVGLEHHFEFWAYKSNDLGAPKLGPVQNHCNILIGPFERGYGGSINGVGNSTSGCSTFTMDQRGSLMWQLYRKTPRRFMYGGSKVPLFHFDLYNFECLSKQKKILINGLPFDPKRFLKAYYNYFYTIAISKGLDPDTGKERIFEFEPIHLFDDLESDYEYVRASLTEMIRFNIISIKDHVPDIVEETNAIIASAKYVDDPETQTQVLKLTPYVDGLVGGVAGYMDLINFFGVEPITGKITADQVRRFLIDPGARSMDLDVSQVYLPKIEAPGPQSYFRFPRRAFLPPYVKGGELVGWGCKNLIDPDQPSVCDGYGSPAANVTEYGEVAWSRGRYNKVFSGMFTNYWLTSTGQLVGNGFNGNGLGNIPKSISVPRTERELTDRQSFGTVSKVSAKSLNFAIALAHFDYNVNFGDPSVGPNACDGKNGGDGGFARPVYSNTNLNRIIAWGINACDYGVLEKNNSQIWQDAASGFSHIVGIKSNFTAGSTYNGIETLVQTSGDNSYGQSFCPNFASGVYEYSLSVPKPGYFTEEEWQGLIDGSFNLVCDYQGDNATENDVRCSLFFNQISGNSDAKPLWSLAGAGQYHTILTQSDNQVRIWGKYFRINKDGTKDPLCPEVDVFIPDEIKGLASQWVLTKETNRFGEEIVKSATVTPTVEQIKFVDGGPDYSMMATKSKVYVWGRKEMIPGAITPVDEETDPEHILMGATGYYTFTVNGEIQNISAGPNCWIVNYKLETENTSVDASLSSFPEYGYIKHVRKDTYDIDNLDKWNFGFDIIDDDDKSSFGYRYMATGYGHISAISFGNIEFPKWDYSLFDLEETKANQFTPQNGKPLPEYFKSFAFFRALPGGWDFSKWIYGKNCNSGLDTRRSPNGIIKCQTPDLCSVLGEPDPNDYTGLKNDTWSYSGHPQYWWMNKAARRYQFGVGLYQSRDSACNDPTLATKPIGGCLGGVQQQAEASQALLTGCQIDYDLCWQIDGQPITTTVGNYWGETNDGRSQCIHQCNDPDLSTGIKVINSIPQTFISRVCTTELGRVGFRSNKDYFLQSYKIFGLKDYCCSTITTYLSYATYALRYTAFARDESTGNWTVQTNPDPYRTGFASNTIKRMAPGSAVLENYLEYPYIYLGGFGLRQLEFSYYNAAFGPDVLPRNPGSGCNEDNLCPYNPTSAGQKILGPGGWIISMLSLDQWNNGEASRPINTDGYYKQGIFSYNKQANLTTPFNLLSGGFGKLSGSTYTWCVSNPLSDGNTGWVPIGNSTYQQIEDLTLGITYCYTRNLTVFDIDDSRNYANNYELSTIKWNKVYYNPILKYSDGMTGVLPCFVGLNGAINSICPQGSNVYVAQGGVIQVADVFCKDSEICLDQ